MEPKKCLIQYSLVIVSEQYLTHNLFRKSSKQTFKDIIYSDMKLVRILQRSFNIIFNTSWINFRIKNPSPSLPLGKGSRKFWLKTPLLFKKLWIMGTKKFKSRLWSWVTFADIHFSPQNVKNIVTPFFLEISANSFVCLIFRW